MNYVIATGAYSKERFNMHQHNDYEIIFYPSGKGITEINGNRFPVEKGTIVIIPPNVMHSSISCDGLRYVSILGNGDHLINLETPMMFTDNEKGEAYSLVHMILANRYGDVEYMNALCLAFVLFVLKNVKINSQIEKAVYKIKRTLSTNFYDSSLCVVDILNDSGYAEDYIRACFKKVVGKTPVEFLTEVRINNAKTLINLYQNSMSLTEIAEHCGFDDYIYFSRKFKANLGVSPLDYKKSISK